MIRKNDKTTDDRIRSQSLLAKIRRRQLDLAMAGRHEQSARYATLAQRIRRAGEAA